MEKPIKTIDDLARLMKNTMASKEDIQELRGEMNQKFEGVDSQFQGITTRLDGNDSRLDRIEHPLLAEQKREIEDLKQRMKRLEDALAA